MSFIRTLKKVELFLQTTNRFYYTTAVTLMLLLN
jgi:hypothetical protein